MSSFISRLISGVGAPMPAIPDWTPIDQNEIDAYHPVSILDSTRNDIDFSLAKLRTDNDRLELQIRGLIEQLRETRISINALQAASEMLNAPSDADQKTIDVE